MTGRRNRSTDRLRSNDIWDTPPSRTSSGYSSTSKLYLKSECSKDNILINFKGTRSILSPEQQRPESAGRRMDVKKNWSTFWHRLRDRIRLHKSRTSSGYSSTSGLSFKSDESKDNIIDFKETRSILSPEQQRPESAGRRRNEWRTRSTDRLSIRDRIRLHKSRTSSEYSSTSGLSFKSDGSKDNTITDFKGRSSSLRADCSPSSEEEEGAADDDDDDDDVQSSDRLPEQQRPESAGRRRNESRTRSTGNMSSNDILDILQERLKTSSMIIIHDFKESSSPSPELQRPESAGCRRNVEDNRSTGNLRSNDIWDIPQDRLKTRSMIIIHDFKESSSPRSRTSSRYCVTSSLSFKSDRSKDIIINFKETRSSLRHSSNGYLDI